MALKTTPFDLVEHLDSVAMIAAYLNSVLEDGDATEIAEALVAVARARQMHGLGTATAVEQSLGFAVEPDELDAVRRGLSALGLRLQVAAA